MVSKILRGYTHYRRGIKLIFTGGHINLVVTFKGLNVTLRLYNCNYSLSRDKELLSAASRNNVLNLIKQGGGLDSACRPCVCHLCTITSGLVGVVKDAESRNVPGSG